MLKTKEQKDSFREKIKKLRTSKKHDEEQQIKSNQIVKIIRNFPTFANAKNIAVYHAVQGEANPYNLIDYNSNKHFYLPILAKDQSQGLTFAPIDETTKYQNNRFSIPEPVYKENELITGNILDLVIVPLVGFDKNGNRIGMGGGFYDRTFAFKQKKNVKPLLIGFAFDFQQTESIHKEDWDVCLDFIATETQLINTQNHEQT